MDQNNVNNNTGQPNVVAGMSFVTGETPAPTTPAANTMPQVSQPVATPEPVQANPIPMTGPTPMTEPVPAPVAVAPQPLVQPEASTTVPTPVVAPVTPEMPTAPVEAMNVMQPAAAEASTPAPETAQMPQPVAPTETSVGAQPVMPQPVIPNAGMPQPQVSMTNQMDQNAGMANNLPPMTGPVVDNSQVSVGTADSENEAKEKKKRNILIVIVLLLLLTAVGIFIGFIAFDMFGKKDNGEVEQTTTEETENTAKNTNVIQNNGVDFDELTEALMIVGIASTTEKENSTMVNYYVSNNNYKDNIKNIIVYYVTQSMGLASENSSEVTLPDDYDSKSDTGACGDAVSCVLISKEEATEILRLYNLGNKLEDYFSKSSVVDGAYGVQFGGTLVITEFNGPDADITHNLEAGQADGEIVVTDNQTIKTYDDEGTLNTEEKTVSYTFKSTDDGVYLESVSVKE